MCGGGVPLFMSPLYTRELPGEQPQGPREAERVIAHIVRLTASAMVSVSQTFILSQRQPLMGQLPRGVT